MMYINTSQKTWKLIVRKLMDGHFNEKQDVVDRIKVGELQCSGVAILQMRAPLGKEL